MIIYKFNVLERLKNNGISTYKIRKDKVLSESTLQRLRQNQIVSIEIIDILCQLLKCQPGDIIEYMDEKKTEE